MAAPKKPYKVSQKALKTALRWPLNTLKWPYKFIKKNCSEVALKRPKIVLKHWSEVAGKKCAVSSSKGPKNCSEVALKCPKIVRGGRQKMAFKVPPNALKMALRCPYNTLKWP